jgi:hypothetical protein
MKISLERLYQKAASRPPGYLEEVLAAGSVKDRYLEITWPEYQRLVAKYSHESLSPSHHAPRNPQPQAPRKSPIENRKLSGLGDAIALIAKPIARAVDRVAKTDLQNCNKCKQRQARLNAAVPFKPGQRHPN